MQVSTMKIWTTCSVQFASARSARYSNMCRECLKMKVFQARMEEIWSYNNERVRIEYRVYAPAAACLSCRLDIARSRFLKTL